MEMKVKGSIRRISGPLVIADGMTGVEMYEMVEVGEERLVGEVTRIDGDTAYIQVYESTTGLRPGDPVYGTGSPLSVELGPGMIGQIYDGIQRPLSVIKDVTGSIFIKRGVKIPPLPRDRKWVFVPRKDLRKGDKVAGGDVLGFIEETKLIQHRVLVPPHLSGRIEDLVGEGEYTIEDKIATLNSNGDKIGVKLYHRWPARRPRPFKEKLEPIEPLITGTRVIDTFFPMAKGGTGAIPGGFGTGKCVLPDTPVLLSDGRLEPIEKIYNRYRRMGRVSRLSDKEEIVDVSDLNLKTVSFDGKRIVIKKITHVYRGVSDKIVKIKTSTGRTIKVTPAHKLFKYDEKTGDIREKPAGLLRVGDKILLPLKIRIPWTRRKVKEYLEEGIEYTLISSSKLSRDKTLDEDRVADKLLKITLPEDNSSIVVREEFNEKLGELLGILFSLGFSESEKEIAIPIEDADVAGRIKELFEEVFGIRPHSEEKDRIVYKSQVLVRVIKSLLGIDDEGSCVPRLVLAAPDEVLYSFVEGYLESSRVYSKKNNGILYVGLRGLCKLTALTYALSRLGVFYRIFNSEDRRISSEKDTEYRLEIHVGAKVALRESAIVKATDNAVSTVLLTSKVTGTEQTAPIVIGDAFADEIEKIEVVEGNFRVYDVTVEETHNFVGGHTPLILHNTVTLHGLAQWSAAKVVIYIGCGERGNEMTEVLEKFPKYKDPWTGRPLMERTILIANTSNMPVSAREASIYVGVTMAEYYRDQGYDVLLVADSTSRWAEALRELAGRLEEMPAEEGYPSYLASRLAEFYERAGRVTVAGNPPRNGSVTLAGAVSPPGGDFTEPVTSHTKRFIRVFWALDTALAYSRHYPAINWLISYSAYADTVADWWKENVDPRWSDERREALNILYREDEIKEIVRLVGTEGLSEKDKLILLSARLIKDGFLKQNAFDPIDAFSPPEKQFKLLHIILSFHREAEKLVSSGKITVADLQSKLKKELADLARARYTVENDKL